MNNNTRARGWRFTWNNYTPADFAYMQGWLEDNVHVIYAIMGKEKGKEKETPHIQGYIYFSSQKSFKYLKECFPKPNWGITNGTPEQNKVYCSKEGDFWETGSCPEQGKRTDIFETADLVKETGSIRAVVDSGKNYQCIKYALTVLPFVEPIRTWKTDVLWFYGPTGSGKTQTAFKLFNDPSNRWINSDGLTWFDGYDGQDNVILDELRAGISYTLLLRLLDRYELKVPFKGGFRQFRAKRIICTSHKRPEDLNWSIGEDFQQLLRRIDECVRFPLPDGHPLLIDSDIEIVESISPSPSVSSSDSHTSILTDTHASDWDNYDTQPSPGCVVSDE